MKAFSYERATSPSHAVEIFARDPVHTPAKHELDPFILLLKHEATLCVVGALEKMARVNFSQVAMMRRHLAGSSIDHPVETQEILDFCAAHHIGPDIEVIRMDEINQADDKVVASEVQFRYVIDMASIA